MFSFLAPPVVYLTECRFCDFYDLSVIFWNCSDSVVSFVFLLDLGIVPTVWYLLIFCQILELFRQCSILVFLLDLGTVPTVWYLLFFCQILELFRQCGISCFSVRFQNCCDCVVSLVFLLDLGTVPTVWYLLFFCQILELFRQCGISFFFCQVSELFRQCGISCFSVRSWNCSDSVLSLDFLLDFGTVSTMWYLLFFSLLLVISIFMHFQKM